MPAAPANPRFRVCRDGAHGVTRPKVCAADLRVCCVAGFQTRIARPSPMRPQISGPAGLEAGDTAGLETCGTRRSEDERGVAVPGR